jgi:hypothetical protein
MATFDKADVLMDHSKKVERKPTDKPGDRPMPDRAPKPPMRLED